MGRGQDDQSTLALGLHNLSQAFDLLHGAFNLLHQSGVVVAQVLHVLLVGDGLSLGLQAALRGGVLVAQATANDAILLNLGHLGEIEHLKREQIKSARNRI